MKRNNASSPTTIDPLSRYLMATDNGCELCDSPGGETLWEDEFCRVVRVSDPDYPGFCRVILRQHLKEMTDLSTHEQTRLMSVVFAVESALRTTYRPDKVNLASFGNVVPHLHWHIIPRWRDDRHYPQPIWGTPQRTSSPDRPTVTSRRLCDEFVANLTDASARRNV